MGKTICVWLLAFLALGWAVPVPESAPLTQEDLLGMIRDADPNENDISKPLVTTDPPEDPEALKTGFVTEDSTLPSETPINEVLSEEKPVLKEIVNQTQNSNETSSGDVEVHVHAHIPESVSDDESIEQHPVEEKPAPEGDSQGIPAPPQNPFDDVQLEPFTGDEFELEEIYKQYESVGEDSYVPTIYEEAPVVGEPSLPLFEEPFIFAKEMESETFEEQPQIENGEAEVAESLSFGEQPTIPVFEEQPQFEEDEIVLPEIQEPLLFDEQPNIPPFEEQSQFEDDGLESLPFDKQPTIPVLEDEGPILLVASEPLASGEESDIPLYDGQPNFEDQEPIIVEDPLPFSEEPIVLNFDEEPVLPEVEQEESGDESIFETEMSFEDNERITQILGDKEVTISFIEPVLIGPEYTHIGEEEEPRIEMSAEEQIMPLDLEDSQLDEGMLTMGTEDGDEMHMIDNPEEIHIILDQDPPHLAVPDVPMISGFVSPAESNDELQEPTYFGGEMTEFDTAGEVQAPVYFDTTDDNTPVGVMSVISEEPVMVLGFGDLPMEQADFPFEETPEVFDDVREDYFIPEDKLTVEDTFNSNEEESFDDLFPVMPAAPMGQSDDSFFIGGNPFVNFPSEMEAPQEDTEEDITGDVDSPGMFISEDNGLPLIEVIQTDTMPETPGQFSFGEPLPLGNFDENAFISDDLEDSDDYDHTGEQIVPNADFVPVTNTEGESSYYYPPTGTPIIFPEEIPPQHNLPVFPQQWNEENNFGTSSDGDIYPDRPSSFGLFINRESSYADYNPSVIGTNYVYGSLPGRFDSYGSPIKPSFSSSQLSPITPFTSAGNGPTNDIPQQSFPVSGPSFIGEMQSDDIEPQVPEIFGNEDVPINEDDSPFHVSDEFFQNPGFPLTPQRLNNFGSSRMPSFEEIATRHEMRSPSTFPFNIRNPYPGMNNIFNRAYFEALFNELQSPNPIQPDESYDIRSPFTPYETYQAERLDSRYPVSSLPNTFDIYGRFPYGFSPYGGDNSYRRPGIYSSRPLNRYALGDRYEDYPFYGFPTPTW